MRSHAARRRRRRNRRSDPDRPSDGFRVIVVGAGVSGLACARELTHRGYEVLVVEARNRVGGRLKGEDVALGGGDGSHPVDMGGALIHGIDRNPIHALATNMGVETHPVDENCLLLDENGWPYDPRHDERITTLFNDCLEEAFARVSAMNKAAAQGSAEGGDVAQARMATGEANVDVDVRVKVKVNVNVKVEGQKSTRAATPEPQQADIHIKREGDTPVDKTAIQGPPTATSASAEDRNTERPIPNPASSDGRPSSSSATTPSFGDVFAAVGRERGVNMAEFLWRWHQSNLELPTGATFDELGYTWNDDEQYGFSGRHEAIVPSWRAVTEGLAEGLDIVYNSPIRKVQVVPPKGYNPARYGDHKRIAEDITVEPLPLPLPLPVDPDHVTSSDKASEQSQMKVEPVAISANITETPAMTPEPARTVTSSEASETASASSVSFKTPPKEKDEGIRFIQRGSITMNAIATDTSRHPVRSLSSDLLLVAPTSPLSHHDGHDSDENDTNDNGNSPTEQKGQGAAQAPVVNVPPTPEPVTKSSSEPAPSTESDSDPVLEAETTTSESAPTLTSPQIESTAEKPAPTSPHRPQAEESTVETAPPVENNTEETSSSALPLTPAKPIATHNPTANIVTPEPVQEKRGKRKKTEVPPRPKSSRRHAPAASVDSATVTPASAPPKIQKKAAPQTVEAVTKESAPRKSRRVSALRSVIASAPKEVVSSRRYSSRIRGDNPNVRRSGRSTKGIIQILSVSDTNTLNYDEPTPEPKKRKEPTEGKRKVAKSTVEQSTARSKKRARVAASDAAEEEIEDLGPPPITTIQVTLQNGSVLEANAVVSTLPLGILKIPEKQPGHVQFIPPLPAPKQTAIKQLGCGLLNKCALSFPSVFWQDSEFLGLARGAHSYLVLNTYKYTNEPILVFMYGGAFAKEIESWTDADVVRDCLAVLKRICGKDVPAPVDYHVTRWGQEQYSKMAFTYIPPGVNAPTQLAAMGEAVYDPYPLRYYAPDDESSKTPVIMFAGEHTTPYHPSTIHGAYLSGIREAYRLDLTLEPTMNNGVKFESSEKLYQRTFHIRRKANKPKLSSDDKTAPGEKDKAITFYDTTTYDKITSDANATVAVARHRSKGAMMTLRKQLKPVVTLSPSNLKRTTGSSSKKSDEKQDPMAPSRRSQRSLSTKRTFYDEEDFDAKKEASSIQRAASSPQEEIDALEDRILLRSLDSYGRNPEWIRQHCLPVHGSERKRTVDQIRTRWRHRQNARTRPVASSSSAWKSWVVPVDSTVSAPHELKHDLFAAAPSADSPSSIRRSRRAAKPKVQLDM